MATTTGLMTVEQFWHLPEEPGFYYELHHGELVRVSRPTLRHVWVQHRLRELLAKLFGNRGQLLIEFPFRALPEHELRAADVGFVVRERWERADTDDALRGAPDIVIEIISRSNTVAEMDERCDLCLANGSCQFWTVDDRRREVKVSTPDGITRTYKSGDSIPLPFADSQSLSVSSVFAQE